MRPKSSSSWIFVNFFFNDSIQAFKRNNTKRKTEIYWLKWTILQPANEIAFSQQKFSILILSVFASKIIAIIGSENNSDRAEIFYFRWWAFKTKIDHIQTNYYWIFGQKLSSWRGKNWSNIFHFTIVQRSMSTTTTTMGGRERKKWINCWCCLRTIRLE